MSLKARCRPNLRRNSPRCRSSSRVCSGFWLELPLGSFGRGSRQSRRLDLGHHRYRPMMTIFVCVSCRRPTDGGGAEVERPGIELADILQRRLALAAPQHAVVKRVDCLAVCERPCTVALTGQDKWT